MGSAMPHWIAAVSGMPFPILCYCFSFVSVSGIAMMMINHILPIHGEI
jgi:hypothetical protein